MSRRRMVDPDIWQDEKFAQLDFAGRLFFIGLITHSNDYGKLRGNFRILKSMIFPYDDDSLKIEEYIKQLNELGIIQIYEINKEKFIKIKNWGKYQTLTYKGKDNIPEPLINPEQTLNQPLINPEEQVKLSKDKLSKDKLNKEHKKQFLEFVLLTEKEEQKLLAEFGAAGTKERIENLNAYLGSKGDKYKSHYYTILNWDRKDKKLNHPKPEGAAGRLLND